jgi:hypothetical protein
MKNVEYFDDFLNEGKKSETKKSIDRLTVKIKGLRKDKIILKKRQKVEIQRFQDRITYLEDEREILKHRRRKEIKK